MNMQHLKILRFLTVLISSTFLCSSSFGDPLPNSQMSQQVQMTLESQMTPESQWIQAGEEPVSIQETLERAYMQNADLDAERAKLRATDETVSQANAAWRPSLSVKGIQGQAQSYPIGKATKKKTNSTSHKSTTGYTATLSQNIYDGGATEANIGVAESNVLAERANLFVTEQTTLLTGIQDHTSILANAAIVQYRIQSRDSYKKILERAEARLEVGEGSRTDVEAARGQYEGAIAALSEAVAALESSKASYLQHVGSPPGKLAPANIIVELPTNYEEALEVSKTHNPTILQARYQLEAAEYTVYLQTADLLPTVDINGTVGNTRDGGTGFTSGVISGIRGAQKTTDLGFNTTVTVPLYQQGIPNSRIRQAYQTVAQQKVQLVGAQRAVVQAVRSAWANLIAARESLKALLAQVKSQEIAIEGAMEEVSVGTISVVDALELELQLITAQINLANGQQQLIVAGYQVLQAMGRLTARDMKLNVKYYDPDAYYNEYKNAWIQFWQGKDWRYVKDGDSR